MEIEEVVQKVKDILGASDRITVDIEDDSIKGIKDELRKAKIRLPLAKGGIAVDFPSSGTAIEIYRIGDAAKSSVPASKPKAAAPKVTKPTARPKAKRHQHVFVRHKMMPDIIDAVTDESSHVLLFSGSTGTGKSVTARKVAEEVGKVLYQANCWEGMSFADLIGEKTVEIDEATGQNHIVFVPGILINAMKEGLDEDGNEVGPAGMAFIDEAGAMPPGVAIGLNRLFESDDPRRTLVIPATGEIVRSHSGFRVILSANTALRGATDMSQAMYTAQMDALDISLINRIAMVFRFGYDHAVEKHILQQKVGDDKIVKMIIQYRDEIRGLIRQGSLSTPFSTRHLVKIADAYRVYGDLGKAIYLTVFQFLMPEERAQYSETSHKLFKIDLLKVYDRVDGVDFL
jgi:MoxR-like ATPase